METRGGSARTGQFTSDKSGRKTGTGLLSLKTSVTVLYQDIGDSSGGVGGDTSGPRLWRWLLMNPSILASAW